MNEQEMREKVIKWLETCIKGCDDSCPYKRECESKGGFIAPMTDALALLKAQEPRVIAWHEVIGATLECRPVYIEVKDSEDKEPGDNRWAMMTQYKYSITNGMIRAMSSFVTSEVLFADRYGKTWRCWTSRPTEEQREAIKWN